MVAQNQLNDEFYDFKLPQYTESDDDEITILLLSVLSKFYDKYMSKSPKYVLKNIEKDCTGLERDLIEVINSNDFLSAIFLKVLERDKITEINDLNELDIEEEVKSTVNVVIATIIALVNQLKYDLIVKAQVWNDLNKVVTDFEIKANYLRAVKRLKDAGRYYNTMATQKVEREALKKVHGNKAQARWRCYGRNPCAWCREQEKMPPRPIDEWEYDHIGGYCGLEVVE